MSWYGVKVARKPRRARPLPRVVDGVLYYSPREVAEQLGVHYDSVRRWIREGRISVVRLGRGPRPPVRISRQALEAFLRGSSSWVGRPVKSQTAPNSGRT